MTADADERSKLLTENGWDKGVVLFGLLMSESTVKVSTALRLLCEQENFPYTANDIVYVTLNFDDKPLSRDRKGEVSMGVSGPEWMTLSSGKGYMPAICIEGDFQMECNDIVKMFHEKYPDVTLSDDQRSEVRQWLDYNSEQAEKLVEAEKHWGLSALQPTKPNYVNFGEGKKDIEWEKNTIQHVNSFFTKLDKYFEAKEDKTYFVANKLTLADCALMPPPWSFWICNGLKVAKRYPNVWAHHEALRATKPAGADDFYSKLPFIGHVVSALSLKQRGIFQYGHHIENPKYWPKGKEHEQKGSS